MPPHKDPRPKTGREKAVRDDVVLGEGKVLSDGVSERADSAMNSIYNLQIEVNEEILEKEQINKDQMPGGRRPANPVPSPGALKGKDA